VAVFRICGLDEEGVVPTSGLDTVCRSKIGIRRAYPPVDISLSMIFSRAVFASSSIRAAAISAVFTEDAIVSTAIVVPLVYRPALRTFAEISHRDFGLTIV
jgi:hypothetical protein